MTTDAFTRSLVDIVADLSRPLTGEQRYRRLLGAFKRAFPCDAAALLRLEGQKLLPLAVDGLRDEALGRRFALDDHPRLAAIVHSDSPVRFPAQSDLPDPYDGLLSAPTESLNIHDCMGVSLRLNGNPWGVITLDALRPGTFDELNLKELEAFIHLAEATVKAGELIRQLERQVDQEHRITRAVMADSQQDIIGKSAVIRALSREIGTVSYTDLSVLVCGETGVGKELVARRLHYQSRRRDQPLIYVNCAALPENLVESELFGHVKGAFSGALQARAGKFELADGGTLFLDEVGEMPLPAQAKLLRALQGGEVQRIGSDRHHRVDVRIIAATNRDLQAEVAAGRFRADLYHRLSVYPITVPPLRDRGRDILLLCGYFLERNARRLGLRQARLTADSEGLLLNYNWPGNVRELEHCISRALLKARRDGEEAALTWVGPEHLDIPAQKDNRQGDSEIALSPQAAAPILKENYPSLKAAVDDFQHQWIVGTLEACRGNKAQAAGRLGMDRNNFYRLLKRLQLE